MFSTTNSLALGTAHHEREVVGEGGEPNLWCPIGRREALL
jgi:hypothetical protein